MRRLFLVLALLATGAGWGASLPLSKVMVSTGHHPYGLVFWQFVIGAAALLAVGLALGRRPRFRGEAARYLALIAAVGTIAPNTAYYIAANGLPAGVMGLLIATVPMFALAIAAGLGLERPTPRRAFGVLLGAAAVTLMVAPSASLPEAGAALFVFIGLIAPFCYGLEGAVIARHAPPDLSPMETLYGAALIGAPVVGITALLAGAWVDPFAGWGGPDWGRAEAAMIGVGLVFAGAYPSYVWLVGQAGPVFASQVSYLVTLFGLGFSMAFLGERYSEWIWLAAALTLLGVALVRPRRRTAETPVGH